MLLIFAIFYRKSSEVQYALDYYCKTYNSKHSTGSMDGTQRYLLGWRAQTNTSPAENSVKQRWPTAASLPLQELEEPLDPGPT